MNFSIKDEYVDLRTIDLDVVRQEVAAGNPYAVIALAQIASDDYGRGVQGGVFFAAETLSAFEWSTNSATTVLFAELQKTISPESRASKEKEYKRIITRKLVDSLVRDKDRSYHARLFGALLVASGHATPATVHKENEARRQALQEKEVDALVLQSAQQSPLAPLSVLAIGIGADPVLPSRSELRATIKAGLVRPASAPQVKRLKTRGRDSVQANAFADDLGHQERELSAIFDLGRHLIEPLLIPAVNVLDDTFIAGDEEARVAYSLILTMTADYSHWLGVSEKEELYRKAGLNLLAAARGGHQRAQVNLGELLTLMTGRQGPNGLLKALNQIVDTQEVAEEVLQAAIAQGAEFARHYLGRLRWIQGRLDEALAHYRSVPQQDKQAKDEMAFILHDLGHNKETSKILTVLADEPTGALACLLLADAYYKDGDFSSAADWYFKHIQKRELQPDSRRAYMRLVEIHQSQKLLTGDDRELFNLTEDALTLSRTGTLEFTSEDKEELKVVSQSLRKRAFIGDPTVGIRRVQERDAIPTSKGEKIYVAPEGYDLSSYIESLIESERLEVAIPFAQEIAESNQEESAVARRWYARAGERGSLQSMRTAIEMYVSPKDGTESDKIEALRLCRLALRSPKKKGMSPGKIRDDVAAVEGRLMGRLPDSPVQIWVCEPGMPPRPITDRDHDLRLAVALPETEAERNAWYRDAADKGSGEALHLWRMTKPVESFVSALAPDVAVENDETPIGSVQPVINVVNTAEDEKPEDKSNLSLDSRTADFEESYVVEPEIAIESVVEGVCFDAIQDAFDRAEKFFKEGNDEAALDIYAELVHQSLAVGLHVAERLSGAYDGLTRDLEAAWQLYNQIDEQMVEHRSELPDDAGNRLEHIRNRVLNDAWTINADDTVRRVRNGVDPDLEADHLSKIIFYPDTRGGLEALQSEMTLDTAIEVAVRLGKGGRDYNPDILASFTHLCDLLLSRKVFPPQYPEALGPLSDSCRKRPELQDLWDKYASRLISVGTDDDGNELYGTVGVRTEAPEFFVPCAAVRTFISLKSDGMRRNLQRANAAALRL